MRAAVLLLIASPLLAQAPAEAPASRALRFAHLETPLGMQEVVSAVRSLTGAPQAVADTGSRTLTVRGSSNQIDFAEWLFRNLDKAAAGRLSGEPSQNYLVPGAPDSVARIFFLKTASTARETQELVMAIRAIAEVQRSVICTESNAIAVRGLTHEVAFTSWLVTALDKPAPSPESAPASCDYQRPGDPNSEVRIFYVNPALTPRDLQELTNSIRSIIEVQRVVPFNARNALVFRSDPDRVSAAEWVVRTLDAPQIQTQAARSFRPPYASAGTSELRVFALDPSTSLEELQQLANRLRAAAGTPFVVMYTARKSIVMRGSPAQMAIAARLVEDSAR
jgi:type II secretory pathway component GspD/PulD (secretin)